MIFSKLVKGIVVLFMVGFVHPVYAENWYQVEVIVFEYLNPDVDGEVWLKDSGIPDYDDVVELFEEDEPEVLEELDGIDEDESINIEPVIIETSEEIGSNEEGPVPFLPLPEENFRMEGVYRVLRLSRDYKPLQHISWQQPALETHEARAVHLSLFNEAENIIEELPPELAEIQIFDELEKIEEPGEPIFDGYARIRSSLFLHVDIDINYFPSMLKRDEKLNEKDIQDLPFDELEISEISSETEAPVEQQKEYVRLKESRKIKLNEMHYFDHPMFGVIVQVSRLEFDIEDEKITNE